jgi:type IV secretion system protein VirB6
MMAYEEPTKLNNKQEMTLVQKIILTILLWMSALPLAYGEDDSKNDWMNSDLLSLGNIFSCVEVPPISGIKQTTTNLNLENPDVWVPAGVYVQQGKMLSMKWNTSGVAARPRKYRVLYRIDPRFAEPQIFIQKYDYAQQKYISDYHHYQNGMLLSWQQNPLFAILSIPFLGQYFSFISRETIQVHKDDVVNVTLDGAGEFFGSDTEMQGGLGAGDDLLTIFTDSSGVNNKILYSSAARWCADIITPLDPDFTTKCPVNTPGIYVEPSKNKWAAITGRPSDSSFLSKITSIPSCPENVTGPDNIPACFYDKGRGMIVSVAGTVIKPIAQKFVYSPATGKYFLYHYSDAEGALSFTTNWSTASMYPNIDQRMNQWLGHFGIFDGAIGVLEYLNSAAINSNMNFLHFGVYAMEIEIGNGHASLTEAEANNISVQYTISDTGDPNSSSSANSASQNFQDNAYASGYLWLKLSGATDKSGVINVKVASYNGSNWFSSVVYDDIVKPLRDKYNELSQILYRKLVGNPGLQNIGKLLLVLYIIVYGLVFLAGAVQITATDLVIRVLKIGVIVALFSETSWTFFNDNLFNVFVSGSDYLFSQVIGVTSTTGNIFGFIDPIFDRYTNPNIWALLAIQLLQIHNGLAFFAIMTIYSILIYFRAILEVIINYCLAFLGLAVMISLAPFFILLILFERTKSMFDNWLSTLFSYMIQPTVLLIFFLLIDQMMAEYITGTVVKACWGILIPIKIGLDLSALHIPLKFSFSLPFLPGIPFFVSQVQGIDSAATLISGNGTFIRVASSSFIFFVYCKLAAGLVEYVSLIVQSLTNVIAARQDGKLQDNKSPVHDIMSDMKKLASPVTGTVKGIGSFAKEKVIDQKITHRTKAGMVDVDYSKITRAEGGGLGDDKPKETPDARNVSKTPITGDSSPSNVTKLPDSLGKNIDSEVKTPTTGGVSQQNRSNSSNVSTSSTGGESSSSSTSSGGIPGTSSSNKNVSSGGGGNDNKNQSGTSGVSTLFGSVTGSKNGSKEQLGSSEGKTTEKVGPKVERTGGDILKKEETLTKPKETSVGDGLKKNLENSRTNTQETLQKRDEPKKSLEETNKKDKNASPEVKNTLKQEGQAAKDQLEKPKNTVERNTDDKLKKKKEGKEFSTKNAGIGDKAKNMTPEQKKEMREKLAPKKPGVARKTDNKLKKPETKGGK